MFYQYLQWQIDLQLAAAQQHARDRRLAHRPVSRPGAGHRPLRLATCGRTGRSSWPAAASGRRPTISRPKGQDWAFPPPNSEQHREDGYRLFAESIRKNCRHGGALRIDHVMRLFRLYWIPDERDATEGAYVRGALARICVRILALESVRNQVVVVGEDLGTVEPVVRETLARFGILSYRLFYFEKNERGGFRRFDEYPVQALVSSTTHDLPTLAGFWTGADIEARRARAACSTRTGYRAQLASRAQREAEDAGRAVRSRPAAGASAARRRRLSGADRRAAQRHHRIPGATPSQLLAINQEDLTKEPPAEPARHHLAVSELGPQDAIHGGAIRGDPEARGFTAMFRNWIERSGRRNRAGRAHLAIPRRRRSCARPSRAERFSATKLRRGGPLSLAGMRARPRGSLPKSKRRTPLARGEGHVSWSVFRNHQPESRSRSVSRWALRTEAPRQESLRPPGSIAKARRVLPLLHPIRPENKRRLFFHQRRDQEALDLHVAVVALDDERPGLGFVGVVGDGGEAIHFHLVEHLGAVVDHGERAADQADVVTLPFAGGLLAFTRGRRGCIARLRREYCGGLP